MHRLIALLLFALVAIGLIDSPAYAANTGKSVLTWTQPTKDVNGNTASLTGNTLYRGTKADGSDLALLVKLTTPATTYTDAALAPGVYCYAVTASNALGESAKSAVVCKTVVPVQGVPQAPVLVSVSVTAYTIGMRDGSYAMIPVGTVPLGTECRQAVKIATLYQVPTASVTTTSKAAWFFAKCA